MAGAALFLGILVSVLFLVARIFRLYAETAPDRRLIAADLFSSTLLGLGIVFALTPFALWWWVNGSPEWRLWIINGPAPYDRLGSGPLQLWIGILLAGSGVTLFVLGILVRRKALLLSPRQ